LCVYAPISSVISVPLFVCTCICQTSYVSLPACLPVYVCASQIHRLCVRSSVPT
jgi:hypothetical protein